MSYRGPQHETSVVEDIGYLARGRTPSPRVGGAWEVGESMWLGEEGCDRYDDAIPQNSPRNQKYKPEWSVWWLI